MKFMTEPLWNRYEIYDRTFMTEPMSKRFFFNMAKPGYRYADVQMIAL